MRGAPVGVQFDVANPLVAGDDALSLFDRVKDRIGYIHLNDAARTGVFEFVAVGTGIAPIPELLRRLTLQGYSGWVSVEEQSRTGKEGFRQAVQFTRKALRSLTSQ
jgi:sugar phosphate isomerase/epimerase